MKTHTVGLIIVSLGFLLLSAFLAWQFLTLPYNWVLIDIPAKQEWKNLHEGDGLGLMAVLAGVGAFATAIVAACTKD